MPVRGRLATRWPLFLAAACCAYALIVWLTIGTLDSRTLIYSLGVFPFLLLGVLIAFERQRRRALRLEDQQRALLQDCARLAALEAQLRQRIASLESSAPGGRAAGPVDAPPQGRLDGDVWRTPSEPAAFDYRAALRKADAEIVEIIAAAYLEQAPRDLAAIRRAAEAGDWTGLERLLSWQRKLAAQFGARPLEELLGALQQQAPDAALRADLTAIDSEIKHLCLAIKAHLEEIPPSGAWR